MVGRGRKRGRGGARGGRSGTRSNLNLHMNSPSGDGEPSAKKAKEEPAAEGLSDLLTQPREILVQIVNNLEPDDFRRLAYTCKYLYNFCLNSRGIRVIFPMKKVYVNKCTRVRTEYLHTCCHCGNFKRNNFEEYLKSLRKWHFAIHIEEFNLYGGGPLLMKALKRDVKNLLERNGVKKICCMTVDPSPKTVREVENFITQYVKAFDIEHVKVEYDEEEPADILKETIEALVKMEVASLGVSSEYGLLQGFSFESVLNCAIPTLDVNAAIGEGDIDKIIQIWKTKNLKNWSFSYSFDSNEIINYFDSYGIRSFNYNGPIDPRNPPVFMKAMARGRTTTAAFSIYFLRADGKIVSITIGLVKDDGAFPIVFRMCPIDEAPIALRNIHV